MIKTKREVHFRWLSDGREVLLTLRCPVCCRAAFCQHGDLGAEVVAIAAYGGLLILCVSTQEPLQHPSAPLTLNLRLHLKEVGKQDEEATLRGYDTQEGERG